MIEVYLFHGMFALQILLGSVLIPRRLLQRGHESIAGSATPLPSGGEEWVKRASRLYLLGNGAVVIIGLLLMGLLFSYMQRPDWDDGRVEVWMGPYFVLQWLPFMVLAWRVALLNKAQRKSLLGEKRRAVLQRRGLFDFVSPFAVALALLCYPLFVAVVFYIARDPFPGFAGPYVNTGIVTALYGVMGFAIYWLMYLNKGDPRQTHAARMQQMEAGIKVLVYSSLIGVLSLLANFSLVLLDRQRLEPFALSVQFVIIALLIYQSMRRPAQHGTQNPAHAGAIR